MRRLSLHIGAHKTGTTTFQETFQMNDALLMRHGLGFSYVAPWPNLHSFMDYVTPGQVVPDGFRVIDPDRLAAFLASHASDHVFGSSENFSFFFQQGPIDDLATALRRVFDDIKIIVYLRRQDRHAVSHHQEGARPDRPHEGQLWGHALTALPLPHPHHRLYLDYDQRMGLWEQAFGRENLIVRVFDRALLHEGDVVSDLLSVLKINTYGLERKADVNRSVGRVQAKIGHIANAALGDDAVTLRLLDAFPWHLQRMVPSATAARDFLAPYLEGNRRLNARLNVTPFENLFPDDFTDYPDTNTETMDGEAWAEAMRVVILTLGRRQSELQALNADDLRKAATAVAAFDAPSALRLVRAAHSLRPTGGFILKLLDELEAQVASPERKAPRPKADG